MQQIKVGDYVKVGSSMQRVVQIETDQHNRPTRCLTESGQWVPVNQINAGYQILLG